MALKFIFGGSGSGKSHYLYERIIEEAGENPGLSYLVLVPEQFTMQTQKDLVMMSPAKGIMNIDVLSFVRLAHRIFEETGKGGFPVLDDEGKNLVLRKIGGDLEGELTVLKGNMRRLGYVSEVKSVLSEFMQYDVGEEQLDQVIAGEQEGSYLSFKLQDLKRLYRSFQDYLKERYTTKEELLDVLAKVAGESALLKKSTVVLDGYTGFTPVQNRLLGELMTICRDVVVTVTIDERENPYAWDHPYQLFAMSKKTVASLVEIARERRVPVEELKFLRPQVPPRFQGSPALAFVERQLFRYGSSSFEGEQDGVELHVAASPDKEAEAAARKVRSLVRKEGYRYREIGVIASDMEVYGNYLRKAFARYEIPVFMDQKRSILLNSFVEYVRSLLAMSGEGFTCDSVFRFLRTGYTSFARGELDDLENYCLALGIRGWKKWQQRWVRRTEGMDTGELDRLNHMRVLFVEKMEPLLFVLRQRRKTVRDITEALYDFMAGEEMQLALKRQEEAFQERGENALAREYAQIYGIVIGLFDKFVELLGEEQVSLQEYCDLLDAGLAEARVGVIPPGIDQVVAGDMERTRLKGVKALLFVGANDTFLPGSLVRTGLLSERDVRAFEKERIALTPGSREQAYVQKYYLYLNLTKPSRKLCVFYSRVSADGKTIRPSYLVQELEKLFPDLAVTHEDALLLKDRELSPRTGLSQLIEGLRMKSEKAGGAWMELYTWYKKNREWGDRIGAILEAGFYRRPQDAITRAAAERLYGDRPLESISRMERFSACAFAHFLDYGLRLKERETFEFQAVDMGNVFHGAIERYSRKASASQGGWTGLDREAQERLCRESVEEAVTDYGNSVLYSSSRNTWLITRIERMMERTVWALTEQLRAGDFRPEAYELKFGAGKIDRVDTCVEEDRVYVKVLDYKTGQTAFDLSLVYGGLQMQLLVYMEEALKIAGKRYPGREPVPAGVFYYHIQDPFTEPGGEAGQIEERLLKELRPDGLVSLEGDSLWHLEHRTQGESLAIPVSFKKDGALSARSKALSGERFRTLGAFARAKAGELHSRIASGEAKAEPYRYGDRTGCDFCGYRHICGFDSSLPGYGYRDITRTGQEEALLRIQAYSGTAGSAGAEEDETAAGHDTEEGRQEGQPWA